MNRHKHTESFANQLKCCVCLGEFRNKGALSRHECRQLDVLLWAFYRCSLQALTHAYSWRYDENLYIILDLCEICEELHEHATTHTFMRARDLIRHKLIHSGERKCERSECGKSFSFFISPDRSQSCSHRRQALQMWHVWQGLQSVWPSS